MSETHQLHDAIKQSLDEPLSQHDRRLTQEWLADLNRVLDGRKPQTDAVISWISGDDDYFLNDFLS